MLLLKIAFRNILRNGRRSIMTVSAIAVGAIAMIVFGEYMGFIVKGIETGTVARGGHLSVFHRGFYEFGAGNPAAYSIARYKSVMSLIENDPALKPMVRVVTPTVSLFGIAGNFQINASKTFMGTGVVPSDTEKMIHWDDYGVNRLALMALHRQTLLHFPLKDNDESHGVVGIGLARMLGLCGPLKVSDCRTPPRRVPKLTAAPAPDVDLAELASRDRMPEAPKTAEPRIDLLTATAAGAPNVVSLSIREARSQGMKEMDDMYVGMDITLAQQLLYGRAEHKALSIVIQLYHTADVDKARARLVALFRENRLGLEVHDFKELQPMYNQVVGLFGAIFVFIAVIMAVIVLFTVVNTMTMSVLERTNEIGTARAMGVRRGGIRRQFLVEGWMIGVIGATAGVVLCMVIAYWFNRAGFTWQPPGQANRIPLLLLSDGEWGLQLSVWLALVVMATIAAFVPANRAARMPVVDALRHV